jgi:hypothetical protein
VVVLGHNHHTPTIVFGISVIFYAFMVWIFGRLAVVKLMLRKKDLGWTAAAVAFVAFGVTVFDLVEFILRFV